MIRNHMLRALIDVAIITTAATGILAQAAPRSPAAPPESGAAVYDRWCASCHADGMPGTIALGVKYQGAKPARIDHWTDLSPDVTAYVVRNGVGAMARFRKTEISDAELQALGRHLARTPAKGGRARRAH